MSNLTTVTVTAGVPTAGTGTVSTLDNLLGTAGTPSANVQSVQGVAGGTAVPVSGTVTANAGTNLNTSALALETGGNLATIATKVTALVTGTVLAAGSALVGIFKIGDGTNNAAIKAASTAPVATDPALVVAISPNSVNANGRKTPANSAPVVMASQAYNTVAASASAQVLTGGSGGAAGDWLDFLLIIPATTAAGAVSITDGAGSAITVWAGGGTTALASLVPFTVPVRAISASGAWKVTTGTNVSVIASGNFT